MTHEAIMKLVEQWRRVARELAENGDYDTATTFQDCAHDLLLAYANEFQQK